MWWGTTSRDLSRVEYSFIGMTPSSILTGSDNTYYGRIYEKKKSLHHVVLVAKIIVKMYKSINVRQEYLMLCNCKLFCIN